MPETNNNWQEKRWGKSKRAVDERSGGGGRGGGVGKQRVGGTHIFTFWVQERANGMQINSLNWAFKALLLYSVVLVAFSPLPLFLHCSHFFLPSFLRSHSWNLKPTACLTSLPSPCHLHYLSLWRTRSYARLLLALAALSAALYFCHLCFCFGAVPQTADFFNVLSMPLLSRSHSLALSVPPHSCV